MTNHPKRESIDLDEGRLDLDSPEAFDPAVDLSAFRQPPSGTADSDSTAEARPEPQLPGPASETPAAAELEELRRERDRLNDQLLRKTAEFDNYRKRIDRERREQAERTVVDVLKEIVVVADDFERALETEISEGGGAYRQGVELIHGKLLEVLRKRGVRPIEAVGTQFDPHLHQAVVHEVSDTHAEGEIIEEFQRGYMLGARLLRPSMVKVAKSS